MKYCDFNHYGEGSRYIRLEFDEKDKRLVLVTKYPGNSKAPEYRTRLEDRDKYVLVVNETKKTAFPVFRWAFFGGKYG